MLARSLLAAALFAFLAPAATAGTLHVGNGAPGSFFSLQDAIAAAQPGDTIVVGPGSAHSSVAGSDGNIVHGSPAMVIEDLQPGEVARVAGLHMQNITFTGAAPTALHLRNNLGAVVLADLTTQTGYGQTATEGAVVVENSDSVSLDGCSFPLWDASISFDDPLSKSVGRAALFVSGSTVDVTNCDFTGSDGLGLLLAAMDGGAGIKAVDSVLRVSRSRISGGFGSDAGLFFPAAGVGTGGAGGGTLAPDFGAGGAAVEASATSLVTTTSDVSLVGGIDGRGAIQSPGLSTAGLHFPVAEALATLGVTPIVTAPGSIATLELGAEPTSTYMTYFSFGQQPAASFPGFHGLTILDLGALQALTPQVTDSMGAASIGLAIPSLPAFIGTTAMIQGLAVSPLGWVSMSSPVLLGVQ